MNCKQGDLALVKKAIRQSNIGKIVTCKAPLGYVGQGETVQWNGERWLAIISDFYWVVELAHGIDSMYGKSQEAYIPDSWLMPIRPEPEKESESTTVPEESMV